MPKILRKALVAHAQNKREGPEQFSAGNPKCIVQLRTTSSCICSNAVARSTTKAIAPSSISLALSSYFSISNTTPHAVLSAPPSCLVNTSQLIFCNFYLALETFFGSRRARWCLLGPHWSTSIRKTACSSHNSSAKSNGTLGWKPSAPTLAALCNPTFLIGGSAFSSSFKLCFLPACLQLLAWLKAISSKTECENLVSPSARWVNPLGKR